MADSLKICSLLLGRLPSQEGMPRRKQEEMVIMCWYCCGDFNSNISNEEKWRTLCNKGSDEWIKFWKEYWESRESVENFSVFWNEVFSQFIKTAKRRREKVAFT